MSALLAIEKTEVDVPWPLPDAEYYGPVVQLRLTEMREGMAEELPPEQQVGIMSTVPKRKPRSRKIVEAVDQFQASSELQDPEGALKRGLEAQPTRPLRDYMEFHQVLRMLKNHGVRAGKQE